MRLIVVIAFLKFATYVLDVFRGQKKALYPGTGVGDRIPTM